MLKLYDAYRKALYLWIRRKMRPLSIEEAEEKKLLMARIYALFTFSICGYITYEAYKGQITLPTNQDLPKNVATALHITGSENIRFIKFKGFKKVEDYTYTKQELQDMVDNPSKYHQEVIPDKPKLNLETEYSNS